MTDTDGPRYNTLPLIDKAIWVFNVLVAKHRHTVPGSHRVSLGGSPIWYLPGLTLLNFGKREPMPHHATKVVDSHIRYFHWLKGKTLQNVL